MSYDYNELVTKINTNRRRYYDSQRTQGAAAEEEEESSQQFLQIAVDTYAELSSVCPMTPLLWMQYSYDTGKLLLRELQLQHGYPHDNDPTDDVPHGQTESASSIVYPTQIQILRLGLTEFPGSAILNLYHIDLLTRQCVSGVDDSTTIQTLEDTIANVGHGSHRNEAAIIVKLYRMDIAMRVIQQQQQTGDREDEEEVDDIDSRIVQAFVRRAKCPMNDDINSTLLQELYNFVSSTHRRVMHGKNGSDLIQPQHQRMIEDARRYESRVYSSFITYEDEIDIAMRQEQIWYKDYVMAAIDPQGDDGTSEFSSCQVKVDWEQILDNPDSRGLNCWMGLGGIQTAQAFIKYANACSHFRYTDDGDGGDNNDNNPRKTQETIRTQMTSNVYERGVAECPTIETIWVSYLQHLLYLANRYSPKHDNSSNDQDQQQQSQQQQKSIEFLTKAKYAVDRACRNCPYSIVLLRYKLNIVLLQANAKRIVLDPEKLLWDVVRDAIRTKFIPTSQDVVTDLSLTIFQIIRRRILFILAAIAQTTIPGKKKTKKKKKTTDDDDNSAPKFLQYDDPEPIGSTTTIDSPPNGDDTDGLFEELDDLCTDCRELYDDVDEYIRKNYSKYGESRARLWSDRGFAELHLLNPLLRSLDEEKDDGEATDVTEVTKAYDKAVKAGQPIHPSIYRDYIQAMLACLPTDSPSNIISKLRQVRYLYQTGLNNVGKSKEAITSNSTFSNSNELDYETSLRCFCHDYLTFEMYFGSELSHSNATKAVTKKLSKIVETIKTFASAAATVEGEDGSSSLKRKSDDNGDAAQEPSNKKQKTTAEVGEQEMDTSDEAKPKKQDQRKIKVGNLEYPAHPYTIKVSYLSPKTEDMDLVDVFRPKCGPIVHAKIIRDKHHSGPHEKGKSKGWGLVQFEDRESVEKALALSDVIGIHEKSVKIERSHLSAVSLVPPGMHRVNPKGQGKSTKRNQKRNEQHQQPQDEKSERTGEDGKPSAATTNQEDKDTKDDESKKGDGPGGSKAAAASVLAFRPRGVAPKSKADKRKPKVSLSTTK
jgi:RNA recognition motif-containing protein